MSAHGGFIAVGSEAVNTASVDYACWDSAGGNLTVTLNGSKDLVIPFETPGCVELATACGLGDCAKEWDKEHKAKVKAAEKAAKEAEAEVEKVETKGHKAHG